MGVLHALIHSREQVSAIAPAVIIVFSILGGAMVPLHSLPEFVKSLSVISPVYWGVDGLLHLVLDQGSWKSVMPHLMVLGGIVVVGHLLSFGLFARKNLL
jgi:ABC-2 type transport system permease protein